MGGEESSPLRRVVANFAAENGRMTAKSFVIDTEAEKIDGEGSIDFAKENYDLTLEAQSKRASLIALRGPVLVDGSFASPRIHVATAPAAARIGASVALGVLAPPRALLPLVEPGGTKVPTAMRSRSRRMRTATRCPRPCRRRSGRPSSRRRANFRTSSRVRRRTIPLSCTLQAPHAQQIGS